MRDGFHSITLGCKLNRFDSAALEGELARRGLRPVAAPELAAVVVLNTCTVTHRADADARKWIRRIRRDNPGCRLLVTGCYAERDARSIQSVGGVDRVFGNRDKPRFAAILDEMGIGRAPAATGTIGDRGCDAVPALPEQVRFGERARAFLKIQDGCRLVCSYCIIPGVRGPSRSISPQQVVHAARALFDGGFREVVLTGVNTGDYGRDLTPRTDLATLLAKLLEVAGPNRIRLNSLEPRTVTEAVVDLMATDPRLAPHLQVPLQSGSDAVLRGMRRNYRVADWLDRTDRIRAAVPDAGIGADLIVGFPGETPAHFAETLRTLERSALDYVHVFSWSPRPGTPAAELAGRVPSRVIAERSRAIREFGAGRGERFRRRFVGATLDAVVLGSTEEGGVRALTGNFIEVVTGPLIDPQPGVLQVRILETLEGETRAEPAGLPDWATEPSRQAGRPAGRIHRLAGPR